MPEPESVAPLALEMLFAQAGDDAERARLLNDKASEIEEVDPVQMLELARRAREFAARSGDRLAWAYSCRHAGIAHHRLACPAEALTDLQSALAQFETLDHKHGQALALSALATVHQDEGRYDRALEDQLRCIALIDELGDAPAKSRSLLGAAEIYCALGEDQNARDRCEQSLAIAREVNDRVTLGTALANLGAIYTRLGQFDRALECQHEALGIKEESGNTLGTAISLSNIAALHVLNGENEKAIGMYEVSLQLRQNIGDRRGAAGVLRHLAELHSESGKGDRALECVNNALVIAEELGNSVMQADLHADCSRIQEALGNYAAALYHFKQSVSFRDDINLRTQLSSAAELELASGRAHDRAVHDHLRHRVYDLEHLALRSQVNPHFLFNALNSIQFFLTNNDRESAHRYLSKLGRLMRASLDHSREPLIPLATELETIETYLQLEQLRFGSRLTHLIAVDSTLTADDILLPPMILQPFVENAVRHGLLPREEAGRVEIHIRAEGAGSVRCIIQDDGIGREESARRKQLDGQGSRHTSLGMRLIADRLALLSERSGKQLSTVVTDLYDASRRPAGTRVEVILPLDLSLFDVR